MRMNIKVMHGVPMRIATFYGTNTGYTEDVADEIKDTLGPLLVESCQNIEDLSVEDLQGYDVLLLGIATWDVGDLPDDWAMFFDKLDESDFTGTKVVMFGLGDQRGYPETFLDAMGLLYRKFLARGAVGGFGFWPTEDYDFVGSLAVYDDTFCGLAIDEDNEDHLTHGRIEKWCAQIKRELGVLHVCPPEEAPPRVREAASWGARSLGGRLGVQSPIGFRPSSVRRRLGAGRDSRGRSRPVTRSRRRGTSF